MSKNIIKCPHCQAEYLPAEIFLPNAVLGRPRDIQKDLNGVIVNYLGTSMDLKESYRCDYCDRKFNVELNPRFFTSSDTVNATKKHKTKLSRPSLFLDEE